VVSDYVRLYGQERIAGINYVAAVTHTDRAYWGPELRHTLAMANDDLTTNIRASRKFVQACFGGRPVGEELDMTLAYTMLVPSRVRAAVMKRSRNSGEVLPELRVPVLVTHGALDRIILPGIADYTAAAVPGGKLSVYEGVGHSPFFEDAPRFNRELAAFARATQQPAST
jgi:pimeloyl-ACP methyl ester carboxylesterase